MNIDLITHPMENYADSDKEIYLQGLVACAVSDNDYDEKEKKFIKLLSNIFNTPIKQEWTESQDVDIKMLETLFNFLRQSESKYQFIVDALFLINIDGNIHKNELHLFKTYLQLLNVPRNISEIIFKNINNFNCENIKNISQGFKSIPDLNNTFEILSNYAERFK